MKVNRSEVGDNVVASSLPVVIKNIFLHDLKSCRVAVIMATYNGERFIEEQIRSIQMQSYSDWILYVRDDGSSDDTVQKIRSIEKNEPRLKLIVDDACNQGAIGNFALLMQAAYKEKADYVFFSDQDDVWHPEKLKTMIAAIQNLEVSNGKQSPILVHSDLTVVDEELTSLSDSFIKFSRLSPVISDLGVLLCQNQVTGCACVINRALLELALPVPSKVLMHDWWLALLASSSGKVGFIPKQLVLYRQHGKNVLGAVPFTKRVIKFFSTKAWTLRIKNIKRSFEQAAILENRIAERGIDLPEVLMKQISVYSQILSIEPLKRSKKLSQNKVRRITIGTDWLYKLSIMTMRKNCDN